MIERELYTKLRADKIHGVVLDFDIITCEELYQLWWKEAVSDSLIADLYGVKKKDVTQKRKQWDLMQYNMIIHDVLTKNEEIDSYLQTREKTATDKVKAIIKEIEGLSDNEKEELIRYLKLK